MDAVDYFTLLAQLMKTNPPAAADAPELREVRQDRPRAGPGFRRQQARCRLRQARFRRSPSTASCCSSSSARRHPGHQRLGASRPRPASTAPTTCNARSRHRHRPRRQPPQDAGLSDLAEGRRRATDLRRQPTSTSMHFPKGQLPPVARLLVVDDVRRRTTSSSPTRSTATRSAPGRT